MEMQQVRYFLAVCDELNFTRAAEACHVAQPSLSRAIKQLEDELGGRLFHRERDRTHLTELGQAMRPYLQEMARQSAEAKQFAAGLANGKRTPLKLGIMCTIGPANLVGLLTALQSRYPEIELQIVDASMAALHDKLLAGELEAAILCLPDGADDRLHAMALFREQFVIAVNRDHALAMRNAIRARDLDGERYLARINCEFSNRNIFAANGATVRRTYRSERDDWVLAMVAAGLGFSFLPQYCVDQRAGIVARPLIEPEVWREVSLVTVRGRPHSPAVGALVREVMQAHWLGAEAIAVQQMREEPEPAE